MIITSGDEWDDFIEDREVVTTFESKDGPTAVLAVVLRGTPTGTGGCTLFVRAWVQDPEPSPTINLGPRAGELLAKMGAPEDVVDGVIDVRGTFLHGIKPGDMHKIEFAEEHPSIGSAVLRLAALTHANATNRLLGESDPQAGLGILGLLTHPSQAL